MAAHVEKGSRDLASNNSGWVIAAARAGYAARGFLYTVIGLLAVFLALGHSQGQADKSGALREIGTKPLGRFVLILLAVAFAVFALWQFLEASLNFEDHGVWTRLGRALRGLLYTSMAWATMHYAFSASSTGGDKQSRDMTARLLGWELGAWLVAGIGLALIGVGLNSGRLATGDRFKKRLELWEISRESEAAIGAVARVGLLARMVVFGLVGAFFIRAALTHDSKEATGLDGALRRLADVPYGRLLLGVLAVGLIAFGCYSFAEARYRTVKTT